MLLDSYRMQGGAPSSVSTKGSVHGQQLRESSSKWSNPLPFLDESGTGPNSGPFLRGLIVLSQSPLHTAPAQAMLSGLIVGGKQAGPNFCVGNFLPKFETWAS